MAKLPKPYDRHEFALRLHFRETSSMGADHFEVSLTLTQYSAIDDDTSSVSHQEWDGLVLSTFGYTNDYGVDQGVRKMAGMGWQPGFETHGTINLYRAEAMAKTLRSLDRGLDRLRDQVGDSAQTFGGQVQRLMAVLGITYVIEAAPGGYHSRWANGERLRRHSKRDIGSYIDRKINDWVLRENQAAVPA